jgi:tetratricopeptide (TPR) repeat protein/outer membrane protein assembly factor BamB
MSAFFTAHRFPSLQAWACGIVLMGTLATAEPRQADFEKSSLALRTALHFDPAAEGPLRKLVELYGAAGKSSELVSLYASHLSQYPTDESASIVLARLYLELKDERAMSFLQSAIKQHPQSALLAWSHHRVLASRFDPKALMELDRAIANEVSATRRALWLGDLLKQSAAQNQSDVVTRRFETLIREQALTLEQRLRWAREALTSSLVTTAGVLVEGVETSTLQGDAAVEAALVLADVEAARGQKIEAAKRLDELLGKLAADYWRRTEVLLMRLRVATDEKERNDLIEESRARWEKAPENESETLALADLLSAVQRKTEATAILEKAALLSPQSRLIEQRLLELLSITSQDEQAIRFLDQRLKADPMREDLALQQLRLLFAKGRGSDASAKLDALLKSMPTQQKVTVHLDIARWLRTRNLLSEAAVVLEHLLSENADRWEARKELGELYGILRRKDDLEKLFAVPIPDDLAPEVRMEVVQFLMAQKQWSQAKVALEGWLKKRPAELDGRLLLARILALTGRASEAATLMEESRAICDTDARYAAWLNAAFDLATETEKESEFIKIEQLRLMPKTGESRDAIRLGRLLALADIAGNAQLNAEAEEIVVSALRDATLGPEMRMELELRQLDLIQRQKGREKELETQLKSLAQKNIARKDDLQLRMALLYHQAQRLDLFASILEDVKISQCTEVACLERGATACAELGQNRRSAEMLERAVQLEPDQSKHWVQWTARLADLGDEPVIRQALQQMIARSARWSLHTETHDLLRRHLAASCWREIGRCIASETILPIDAHRALTVVEEAERSELDPERKRWCVWTRGWLGQILDDRGAIQESLRVLGGLRPETLIPFPDGLSLAVQHARETLTEPAPSESSRAVSESVPPLSPLMQGWGYTAEKGSRIQRFSITPNDRFVIVVNDRSVLTVLDRKSGKLCWSTAGTPSRRTPSPPIVVNSQYERVLYPIEYVSGVDHVFALRDGCIECRELTNGRLIWSVNHAPKNDHLEIVDDLLLVWQPNTGLLDAYSSKNGKLKWTQKVELLSKAPTPQMSSSQSWISSGISADAGKVLVYGNGAAVVRSQDGALLWLAHAGGLPSFPLELRTADQEASGAPDVSVSVPWTQKTKIQPGSFISFNGMSRPSAMARRTFTHPASASLVGYPGMYGGAAGAPFLNWGSDSIRLLRGRTLWTFDSNGQTQQVSVSGIPLNRGQDGFPTQSGAMLGFAGGSPVMAASDHVFISRVHQPPMSLWESDTRRIRSSASPTVRNSFPAATLAGRTLLVSTPDQLMARDAVSGEILFDRPPPESISKWAPDAWDSMQSLQSTRWTAKGVMLYDGQGSSLVVDWRSASAEGDWIIPVGLDKLACLRELQDKTTASAETKTQ